MLTQCMAVTSFGGYCLSSAEGPDPSSRKGGPEACPSCGEAV